MSAHGLKPGLGTQGAGAVGSLLMSYLEKAKVVRTFTVAHVLDIPTPKARRLLMRLERDGIVRRNTRYSAVNDIAWDWIEPEARA